MNLYIAIFSTNDGMPNFEPFIANSYEEAEKMATTIIMENECIEDGEIDSFISDLGVHQIDLVDGHKITVN